MNPSNFTVGLSVIVPRWLYVIAAGTPVDLVGDPITIDEPVKRFDPDLVDPGDIVAIGIHTGNCLPGYRVLKEAKSKGAKVIMGGVHSTIFPDEPLKMGADSVVTGNGDIVWSRVVKDALDNKLQRKYHGGHVSGEDMLKARWDLLNPRKYLLGSIQTIAGCPENCSFCSVWVTEGRKPRQHLTEKIIEEANELYQLGFRYILFADDNFNPSTLGRIAREPSAQKRKELEQIREERLRFFDEYDKSVPKNLYGFTQMTTEVISDEEYISAMYHKMRIRGALIGVESFTEEGLRSANKQWNPVGQKMVETIQKIQNHGILVLSSIICGLESDTFQTVRTMREFAKASGTALAQFAIYTPYPGTVDFYEMIKDKMNQGKDDFIPKHKTQILYDKFWLEYRHSEVIFKHPHMSSDELIAELKNNWKSFYSLQEIFKRTRIGILKSLPIVGKVTYFFACIVFKILYPNGIAADTIRNKKIGSVQRISIEIAIYLSRLKNDNFGAPLLNNSVRLKDHSNP